MGTSQFPQDTVGRITDWVTNDSVAVALPGMLPAGHRMLQTIIPVQDWENAKSVWLALGACGADVSVVVNGKQVGKKTTGFERQFFEVTRHTRSGAMRLVLEWEASVGRAWMAEAPFLMASDGLHWNGVSVKYHENLATISYQFAKDKRVKVGKGKFYSAENLDCSNDVLLEMETSKESVQVVQTVTCPVPAWSPEYPDFLSINLTETVHGSAEISREVHLAKSKATVNKEGLVWNARAFEIKGARLGLFCGESGPNLDVDGGLRKELNRMRRNHLNTIYWTEGPAPESLLDLCDEVGLWVIDHASRWNSSHPSHLGMVVTDERGAPTHVVIQGQTDQPIFTHRSLGEPWIDLLSGDLKGSGLFGWSKGVNQNRRDPSFAGCVLSAWLNHASENCPSPMSPGIAESVYTVQGKNKPHLSEVSATFAPMRFGWSNGTLVVENDFGWVPEERIQIQLRVLLNGKILPSTYHPKAIGTGAPGSYPVSLNWEGLDTLTGDLHLQVSAVCLDRKLGLGFPFMVRQQSFALRSAVPQQMDDHTGTWEWMKDAYVFKDGGRAIVINATNATVVSMLDRGRELLAAEPQWIQGRPPASDGRPSWPKLVSAPEVEMSEVDGAALRLIGQHLGSSFVANYRVDSSGALCVRWAWENPDQDTLECGVQWSFPEDVEQVEWTGDGPFEQFAFRNAGSAYGLFRQSKDNMWTEYGTRQTTGQRMGWDHIYLKRKQAEGIHLQWMNDSKTNMFSVTPFSVGELNRPSGQPWPIRPFTFVRIMAQGAQNVTCDFRLEW